MELDSGEHYVGVSSFMWVMCVFWDDKSAIFGTFFILDIRLLDRGVEKR